MKNILAENLLRFGVRNLSESDIKRIEETVLTEGITKTDVGADVNVKTALVKQANTGVTVNVPFVIGEYIFNPEVVEADGPATKITGFVQKFITNTNDKVGKVILYPDFNNKNDGYFILENYSLIGTIMSGPNTGKTYRKKLSEIRFDCIYETGAEGVVDGAAINKMANDAINIHKNLNIVTAAYNANPNKSSYDTLINTMRNEVKQTVTTGANTAAKNFAAKLTGTAKSFYNLTPETAAPTTQPAPQKQ